VVTSRERLRAALNHVEPDRVPIDLGSTHSCIESYAYEPLKRKLKMGLDRPMRTFVRDHVEPDEELLEYFGVDTRYIRIRPPAGWTLKMEPDNSFVDEWGTRWRKPESSLYYDPVGYPLEHATIDDLEDYPWPVPGDPARTAGLREQARKLYDETGYALCTDTVGLGIFETSWMLRGFQNFLCDLAGDQEFASALMARVCEVKIGMYRQLMAAVGEYLEVVFVSDDLGTQDGPMISLDLFRRMIRPHEERLWRDIKSRTRAKLFLHSCGSVRQFIPDLIEMGLDILNPTQPSAYQMDTAELKRQYGRNLVFWGAVDEQGALSRGTPEQVREEVCRRIHDLAPGGGYVLAPSHNIQADVSPENIVAMYRSALELGRYPIRC
jgi:uroporphyrinogen decarboxylase